MRPCQEWKCGRQKGTLNAALSVKKKYPVKYAYALARHWVIKYTDKLDLLIQSKYFKYVNCKRDLSLTLRFNKPSLNININILNIKFI